MLILRPLSNDPRFIQCIYCYSHASKRFVEVKLAAKMETKKQKMISPGLYPKRFHQEKIFVQFRPQTDQRLDEFKQ